ncbi:MAG: carbamoyltransferase, partial [Planctomyces sp.]
GLAPYGRPVFSDLILQEIVHLRDDGSFQLNLSAFNFWRGLTMPSRRFEELFGGPARVPESELTQRELDLAASIQSVMETILLRMGRHAKTITGLPNLCLAGGVALNCSATGKLMQQQIFDRCWIQPAAGDAGGALGCALSVWYQLLRNRRCAPGGESGASALNTSSRQHRPREQDADGDSVTVRQSPAHSSTQAFSILPDFQKGSLLGPRYDRETILQFLNESGAFFREVPFEDALCLQVAELIRDGCLVGWFHGRMEFGPRALGARSILGDPRHVSMKERINAVTKRRESFRPFAPAVLEERVSELFDVTGHCVGPYMTSVATVLDRHRTEESFRSTELGLKSGLIPQTTFPAVTHVDLTCRVQTVDRQRHPRLHRLLTCFDTLTGIPMLINTSFNVRGMPIVCTPQDAYACFLETDLDVLVLEDFVLLRKEQKPAKNPGPSVRSGENSAE